MRTTSSFVSVLLATVCSVEAFSPSKQPQFSRSPSTSALSATRRETIEKLFGAAFSAGAVLVAAGGSPAQAANDEEYNELIATLKARSEANKEANENYARRSDKLSKRDFKDIKANRPKLIVVNTGKDGNKLFSSEEFATLFEDGKISTEYGTRKKQGGGDMIDYTNVIYTLKE